MAAIQRELSQLEKRNKLGVDDVDTILKKIERTTTLKGFDACDLVIEAITEDLELKKKAFKGNGWHMPGPLHFGKQYIRFAGD